MIKLPQSYEFLANLILQRTGAFIALGGGTILNKCLNEGNKEILVKFLEDTGNINSYVNQAMNEIHGEVIPVLQNITSNSLERVVSIGPGCGIFECFLCMQGFTKQLLLIDIEDSDRFYQGYSQSGYANLAATKEFIQNNCDVEVLTCNPQKEILPNFNFTLALSILSMGFHYPCDSYVEFISSASSGSLFIMDKRLNVADNGYAEIVKHYSLEKLFGGSKSNRVILKRLEQ